MKTFSISHNVRAGAACLGALALALLGGGFNGRADDAPAASAPEAKATTEDAADKAWKEVRKAAQSPMPPAEWQTNKPSAEAVARFFAPRLIEGADKAKDFYTRFPNNEKAAEARTIENRLLTIAVQRFGDKTQVARLEALEEERLKDPKATDEEKIQVRMSKIQKLFAGMPGTRDEVEKSLLQLQKDFPKDPTAYQYRLMLATDDTPEKAKAVATEMVEGSAPERVKEAAKGVLKRLESVGKPLDIQFTAVDGRAVDLGKMKDKVVLVDFWATWCGPCVGEVPHVKETYEKLHPKGFEIVGISFDQSKENLEKFVEEKKMGWPQYFDGQGWQNKFGKEFGINSIPTMWLVDKKGNLREINAREELEAKVTKLLAE